MSETSTRIQRVHCLHLCL